MQLSDRGGQQATRPAPNPTINPGWANNDLTQSTQPTIGDPDLINAIMAELQNVATATGQTLSKTNVAQVLASILRVAGGYYTPVTGNVTLTCDNAGLVVINAAGGNIAVTMPQVASAGGAPLPFKFVRADNTSNTVTFSLHAGDTLGLNGSTGNFTLAAGELSLVGDGVSRWIAGPQSGGQALLSVTSGTVLTLAPNDGNGVIINGVARTLPPSGVTVSNAGLAASTVYNVYLSDGPLALNLSTTGHVTDTSAGNIGTEIKSGDSTQSFVGKIVTNASGQFQDGGSVLGCLNWFKRSRRLQTRQNTVSGSTATTSGPVVINSAQPVTALVWADEAVLTTIFGSLANTSGTGTNYTDVGIDGTAQSTGIVGQTQPFANAQLGALGAFAGPLAEGLHTFTMDGYVNQGAGSWSSCQLTVETRG